MIQNKEYAERIRKYLIHKITVEGDNKLKPYVKKGQIAEAVHSILKAISEEIGQEKRNKLTIYEALKASNHSKAQIIIDFYDANEKIDLNDKHGSKLSNYTKVITPYEFSSVADLMDPDKTTVPRKKHFIRFAIDFFEIDIEADKNTDSKLPTYEYYTSNTIYDFQLILEKLNSAYSKFNPQCDLQKEIHYSFNDNIENNKITANAVPQEVITELLDPNKPSLMVGHPYSGKTTFINYLLKYWQNHYKSNSFIQLPTPIYIELDKDFRSALHESHFIEQYIKNNYLSDIAEGKPLSYISRLLTYSNRFKLIINVVDELDSNQCSLLTQKLRRRNQQNAVIISRLGSNIAQKYIWANTLKLHLPNSNKLYTNSLLTPIRQSAYRYLRDKVINNKIRHCSDSHMKEEDFEATLLNGGKLAYNMLKNRTTLYKADKGSNQSFSDTIKSLCEIEVGHFSENNNTITFHFETIEEQNYLAAQYLSLHFKQSYFNQLAKDTYYLPLMKMLIAFLDDKDPLLTSRIFDYLETKFESINSSHYQYLYFCILSQTTISLGQRFNDKRFDILFQLYLENINKKEESYNLLEALKEIYFQLNDQQQAIESQIIGKLLPTIKDKIENSPETHIFFEFDPIIRALKLYKSSHFLEQLMAQVPSIVKLFIYPKEYNYELIEKKLHIDNKALWTKMNLIPYNIIEKSFNEISTYINPLAINSSPPIITNFVLNLYQYFCSFDFLYSRYKQLVSKIPALSEYEIRLNSQAITEELIKLTQMLSSLLANEVVSTSSSTKQKEGFLKQIREILRLASNEFIQKKDTLFNSLPVELYRAFSRVGHPCIKTAIAFLVRKDIQLDLDFFSEAHIEELIRKIEKFETAQANKDRLLFTLFLVDARNRGINYIELPRYVEKVAGLLTDKGYNSNNKLLQKLGELATIDNTKWAFLDAFFDKLNNTKNLSTEALTILLANSNFHDEQFWSKISDLCSNSNLYTQLVDILNNENLYKNIKNIKHLSNNWTRFTTHFNTPVSTDFANAVFKLLYYSKKHSAAIPLSIATKIKQLDIFSHLDEVTRIILICLYENLGWKFPMKHIEEIDENSLLQSKEFTSRMLIFSSSELTSLESVLPTKVLTRLCEHAKEKLNFENIELPDIK
ncbi:hypothetical protein EMN47_07660 [Prolixibacteraceae bacterium JC049]|nr:hypothetical protein [Prolixibacteraceae bacterium JC049]